MLPRSSSAASRELPLLTFFGNSSAAHTHHRVCVHARPRLRSFDLFDPASLRSLVPPSTTPVSSDSPAPTRTPSWCLPVAGPEVVAGMPTCTDPAPPPASAGGESYGPSCGSHHQLLGRRYVTNGSEVYSRGRITIPSYVAHASRALGGFRVRASFRRYSPRVVVPHVSGLQGRDKRPLHL